MSSRLRPFEYKILRALGREFPEGSSPTILVACSGGRDSIALLLGLAAVTQRRSDLRVVAGHVHHGPTRDPDLARARDEARKLVRTCAAELRMEFVESPPESAPHDLSSEADLRAYRRQRLAELAQSTGAIAVALAHHAQDLLETRLIRLVRGTSSAGLEAMRVRRGVLWRPLLETEVCELAAYVADRKARFAVDPSNAENGPLRNWMRNEWMPALEAKRPGSLRAIARSLEMILADVGVSGPEEVPEGCHRENSHYEIERSVFRRLAPAAQARALAGAMRTLGAGDVTAARVKEVKKRLSSARRSYAFHVGGVHWEINAERISLRLSSHVQRRAAFQDD